MQNNFLDKREKTDSEEDNVVMMFMNSFNAVYTFTTLQMKIILICEPTTRTIKIRDSMIEETVFCHMCKKNQFLIL